MSLWDTRLCSLAFHSVINRTVSEPKKYPDKLASFSIALQELQQGYCIMLPTIKFFQGSVTQGSGLGCLERGRHELDPEKSREDVAN